METSCDLNFKEFSYIIHILSIRGFLAWNKILHCAQMIHDALERQKYFHETAAGR